MSKHRVLQRPIHGAVVSNVDLLGRTVGNAFDSHTVLSKEYSGTKEELRKTQVLVIVTKATPRDLKDGWMEWAKDHDVPVLFAERKAAVLQQLQDDFEIVDPPKPKPEPEPEYKKESARREVVHVEAPPSDPTEAAMAAMRKSYEAQLADERAKRQEADDEALAQMKKAEAAQDELDSIKKELRDLRAELKSTEESAQARAKTVLSEEVDKEVKKATKSLSAKNRTLNKTINEMQRENSKLRSKVKDQAEDIKKRAKENEQLRDKMKNVVFDDHDIHRSLSAAIVAHAIAFSDDDALVEKFDKMLSELRSDPNFGKAVQDAHTAPLSRRFKKEVEAGLSKFDDDEEELFSDEKEKGEFLDRAVRYTDPRLKPGESDDPEFQRITRKS